jgi:hypothetical protein
MFGLSREIPTRLADAFDAAASRIGVCFGADDRSALHDALVDPVGNFISHPNWPTGVAGFRSPFAVSAEAAPDGERTLRFVLDATDHRVGLGANWPIYMEIAHQFGHLTPDGEYRVWQALASAVDAMTPLFRSRVLMGASYCATGPATATAHISTSWMSVPRLMRTFTGQLGEGQRAAIAGVLAGVRSANRVSYEFRDGHVSPPAFTVALEPVTKTTLLQMVGATADLHAAAPLVERFWPADWQRTPEHAVVVHVTPDATDPAVVHHQLQLNCQFWALSSVRSFAEVLGLLESQAPHAVAPLGDLLSAFAELRQPLSPLLLGVSGAELSSALVRFDLYPGLLAVRTVPPWRSPRPEASGDGHRGQHIDQAIDQATGFLMKERNSAAHWTDFDVRDVQLTEAERLHLGASDEFVTGYVLSVLATLTDVQSLGGSAQWLEARVRDTGWGWSAQTPANCEATCLALLALSAAGCSLPIAHPAMLERYRLPSGGYTLAPEQDLDSDAGRGASCLSGLAMSAMAETHQACDIDAVRQTIQVLLAQKRGDRGWNSFWWREDLVATHRVLAGLEAVLPLFADDGPTRREVEWTLANTWPSVQARPLGNDPFSLGVWLACWGRSGGSWHHPSVGRIVTFLERTQQPDGRWLASPSRRLSSAPQLRPWARPDSGQMFIDQRCVVTTATVLRGLACAREGLAG